MQVLFQLFAINLGFIKLDKVDSCRVIDQWPVMRKRAELELGTKNIGNMHRRSQCRINRCQVRRVMIPYRFRNPRGKLPFARNPETRFAVRDAGRRFDCCAEASVFGIPYRVHVVVHDLMKDDVADVVKQPGNKGVVGIALFRSLSDMPGDDAAGQRVIPRFFVFEENVHHLSQGVVDEKARHRFLQHVESQKNDCKVERIDPVEKSVVR